MRSSVSSEPPFRRRLTPQSSLFFRPALIFSALLLGAGIALRDVPSAAESARSVPPPVLDTPANPQATSEVAIFAGGCFWGSPGVFQHVQGVTSAVSGYAGGAADTVHYEMVGTNTTGHAESVRITFDPRRISYGQMLQIYFSVAHNPTELNRQGLDVGSQYRSAIFYHSPEQEQAARALKSELERSHRFSRPIVTQIVPATTFYEAEDYHQQYLEKRGLASCHIK